ncbi:SDR family oxidoreductase [Myxococcota bacterium]|nr:SDR family oxidoreductase [Myxococcota bacterium]
MMAALTGWLAELLDGRPRWMNVLMIFCAYMAFVYLPWDLFIKPAAMDQEVWFGIMFVGWQAKLAEPLHWFVYATGTYGFLRMRTWMWPWASLYVFQVAFSMWAWAAWYQDRWWLGLLPAAVFCVPAVALWRARERFQPNSSLRERYGEWALVTGASGGLGAEFARALAAEGMSCLLTARRRDRLDALAEELERDHGVATRSIVCDLADPVDVERLAQAAASLDLGLLVNNAGYGYHGRFDKQATDRLRDMVSLNCSAPVVLTSRLLPAMRERKRGAVIITGSVSSYQPLPLHAVYAATKAFDQHWGEALATELTAEGIDVLVVAPGVTETEFQAVAGELPHGGAPPAAVVREALEALGRQTTLITGWFNWARAMVASRLLPRRLAAYAGRWVTEKHTPKEMR